MLLDRFSRQFTYLRISVTDRCNFRCVYCMPAEGIPLSPRHDLLTFEEIERVVRAGAQLGLSKLRLTGGEPTVRKDLPLLVRRLKAVPGIGEVSMTTNAATLEEQAPLLKDSGLDRLNISLDTLDRNLSQEIARRDYFDKVHRGIELAHKLGFPLKFNTVVMRGTNDHELADLVLYARRFSAQIRFIEYMPMGAARLDDHNKLVTAAEIQAVLQNSYELQADESTDPKDPARGFICRRTGAKVAFISSMSANFCGACNRMRLTASGGLRPCLHQDAEVDVRAIIRGQHLGPELDAALQEAYWRAAGLKWAGHHMNDVIPLYSTKEMVSIGG